MHVCMLFDDSANHIADVPVDTSTASTSLDDPNNLYSRHGIASELERLHHSAQV